LDYFFSLLTPYTWRIQVFYIKTEGGRCQDHHSIITEMFGVVGQEKYRAHVSMARDREDAELRTRMRDGIIGSQSFQDTMRADLLAAQRPRRGRPRKISS